MLAFEARNKVQRLKLVGTKLLINYLQNLVSDETIGDSCHGPKQSIFGTIPQKLFQVYVIPILTSCDLKQGG